MMKAERGMMNDELESSCLLFIVHRSSFSSSRSTARDETDHRDEQGRAEDRPDDRKTCAADDDREQFRQPHVPRHPQPDDRADEAERDGDETPAARVARNRLPD